MFFAFSLSGGAKTPSACSTTSRSTVSSSIFFSFSFNSYFWFKLELTLFNSSAISLHGLANAEKKGRLSSIMKKLFLLIACFTLNFSYSLAGDLPPIPEPQTRPLKEIEDEIEKLKSSLEVMEQEYHVLIRRTIIGFNNANYIRGGLSLLLPRTRTFEFRTDTGLGFLVGYGHYFGKNHVAEMTLDWDMYFATTLRYRYELQGKLNSFVLAPVIGAKIKLANLKPFDNFLDEPDSVKHVFPLVGGLIAFPMNRSLLTLEADYLFNSQAFIIINLGIHYFL